MTTSIAKLAALSGGPLGPDTSKVETKTSSSFGPNIPAYLDDLLGHCNGFYCFFSALHVFPLGVSTVSYDVGTWNSVALWRTEFLNLIPPKLFCFAEDIFGGQFCFFEDKIVFFDPEVATITPIASNLEEWAAIVLADPDTYSGFPFAEEWQKVFGVLPNRSRLVPKIPFVCGGEYSINNFAVMESSLGMRSRANVALQLLDCADGTKVGFDIK